MSDDWAVVDAAIGTLEAQRALARLREREAQLERERDGYREAKFLHVQARAEAAEARIALLLEEGDVMLKQLRSDQSEWKKGAFKFDEERRAAEARVARLEEALREIAEGDTSMYDWAGIARRALAHEDES